MHIVFFEARPEEHAALTAGVAPHTALCTEERLTPETAQRAAEADVVSVFVNSPVTAEVIAALPKVRLIATRSTGFDHIDLPAAKARGIVVSTVPAYGSRTVAEFTFALILNLSRKVFQARLQLLQGRDFSIAHLGGFDLQGKTLGVVGTGKIGKNVVRIAKGFDMQIVAHDRYPDAAFAAEMGYEYVDLPTLLARSDIVTLHCPYTNESHHLVNAGNISLMKEGSLLINTARGELVETGALVQALASGRLAGAGLDVLESERQLKEEAALIASDAKPEDFKTLFENQILLDHPHVIVTPHIAFHSKEAVAEIQKTTLENIRAFEAGTPQNVVS